MISERPEPKEVTYVCKNAGCGATQTPKFWPEEAIYPVLNCWSCGAGRNMPIEKQMQTGLGMFPVQTVVVKKERSH